MHPSHVFLSVKFVASADTEAIWYKLKTAYRVIFFKIFIEIALSLEQSSNL